MTRVALAVLCAAGLAGCSTIYNPATERNETVLDTSIEVALGKMAQAQMGLSAMSMGKVEPQQLTKVQQIGARIAKISDRHDVQYQFGVVSSKSINAFTLPGGTIYVHTATIEKATDDELAAVIAHEVGHVAARHVAKHLVADLGVSLLLTAASKGGGAAEGVQVANEVYGLISRGFSRQDELQADSLGIKYLARAGYDPNAMVTFFEKMEKEQPAGSGQPVWMMTHPLTSDRIAAAKKQIAEMQGQSFCPVCGREYPGSKKFCAVDGAELKPKK